MYSIYPFADVNECETGKHHCNSNAFCNNTKGFFLYAPNKPALPGKLRMA